MYILIICILIGIILDYISNRRTVILCAELYYNVIPAPYESMGSIIKRCMENCRIISKYDLFKFLVLNYNYVYNIEIEIFQNVLTIKLPWYSLISVKKLKYQIENYVNIFVDVKVIRKSIFK